MLVKGCGAKKARDRVYLFCYQRSSFEIKRSSL